MSDGVNAGSPFGHRTWAQLKDALYEAERFGQNRTNEVVELTTEIASLRAQLAAAEKVVEAARGVVTRVDAEGDECRGSNPNLAPGDCQRCEEGLVLTKGLRAALAEWDKERGTT